MTRYKFRTILAWPLTNLIWLWGHKFKEPLKKSSAEGEPLQMVSACNLCGPVFLDVSASGDVVVTTLYNEGCPAVKLYNWRKS